MVNPGNVGWMVQMVSLGNQGHVGWLEHKVFQELPERMEELGHRVSVLPSISVFSISPKYSCFYFVFLSLD